MNGYQIHEFAELAGVTVKALRHYERLGLLHPQRSQAGYRMYTDGDLERLEEITALKFLGFPLRDIAKMVGRSRDARTDLSAVLSAQRRAIEAKHQQLGRAIRAIQAAEESARRTFASGTTLDSAALKEIIRVVSMEDGIEMMKKYYGTEESWQRRQRYYREGPSAEWQRLYGDVAAAVGQDPGGEIAQALVDRWLALGLRAAAGDPDAQTDSATAWMDRRQWPPAMKRRIARFHLEEVTDFIREAAISSSKKYFSSAAWDRLAEARRLRWRDLEAASMSWQARVDLFTEIEAAVGQDPAGARAQDLALHFLAHIDSAGESDPEIKAGLMNAWADRRKWSATLRHQVEAICMLPYERFMKCADFIDEALVAQRWTRL